MAHFFDVDAISLNSNKLFLIAGPCVLDETGVAKEIATEVAKIAKELEIPFVFKASYTKANRTSGSSFRGVGIEQGLKQLEKIKGELNIPLLSDVHCVSEVEKAGKVLDILQIPAFLCRQTSLLEAAAQTQKAVNIKKGQFLAPWDMKHAVEKITKFNNKHIMLTERGTCFGYNNLVVDMRSLVVMKEWGYPIIFDGTHSVQLPGAGKGETSGQREMILPLVRGAVATGCHGLFLEVHPQPEKSPSDSASILPLENLVKVLQEALKIHKALNT